MSYITREDGERFVIPSYRDILIAKQKGHLKKEVVALSSSYGDYITLQKKGPAQYEVAFSQDTGYLLGETIWHQFKKPMDLIYCEAIPDTSEAILVIVKAGSVYLDGRFPVDSIPEELIIFLTQQNNFEIYVYGDVPISKEPEAGKFSFEAGSVKSFTVLEKPVFPSLPLLRMYQLQLVDLVLKSQGIGGFPTGRLIALVVLIGLTYLGYSYFTAKKQEVVAKEEVDPYEAYYATLASPEPEHVVAQVISSLNILFTMPGWGIDQLTYEGGTLKVTLISQGGTVEGLFAWGKNNNISVNIYREGIYLMVPLDAPSRPKTKSISRVNETIAIVVDRMAAVFPANNLRLGEFTSQGVFTNVEMTMGFDKTSPAILDLMGKQFRGLPLVLQKMTVGVNNDSSLIASITLQVLGN